MQIEINTNNSKKVTKLLSKFLDMAGKSEYNYLNKDKIVIGENQNSGFIYLYLENNPSLSLCLDDSNEFCIVYSSGLDGLEFISFEIPSNIDKLETKLNRAYNIEDDIRGDDYNDSDKTDAFINAMEEKGWALI